MDNPLKIEMIRVLFYDDRDHNMARIAVDDDDASALFDIHVPKKLTTLDEIRRFATAKAKELAVRAAAAF